MLRNKWDEIVTWGRWVGIALDRESGRLLREAACEQRFE